MNNPPQSWLVKNEDFYTCSSQKIFTFRARGTVYSREKDSRSTSCSLIDTFLISSCVLLVRPSRGTFKNQKGTYFEPMRSEYLDHSAAIFWSNLSMIRVTVNIAPIGKFISVSFVALNSVLQGVPISSRGSMQQGDCISRLVLISHLHTRFGN